MSADIPARELGPFGDNLGQQNGESRRVCLLPNRPGWLYKEYWAPLPDDQAQRLLRLVRLPSQMGPSDMALVGKHVSWPISRVVNGAGDTVGVILPKAADSYDYEWKLPSGKTKRGPLQVDVLALSEEQQARKNLPAQTLVNRISVCASIAAVGSLFERHGLVYLDWCYANAFWSVQDHSAYVIDMDGCSFGPRAQIKQPGWEDPLVPFGAAGNECDRYRIALLTARCLTGERAEAAKVRSVLSSLRLHSESVEQAIDLLLQALTAERKQDRPSVERISTALNHAAGFAWAPRSDAGGVRNWKPIASKTGGAPTFTWPASGTATNGTGQASARTQQAATTPTVSTPRAKTPTGSTPTGRTGTGSTPTGSTPTSSTPTSRTAGGGTAAGYTRSGGAGLSGSTSSGRRTPNSHLYSPPPRQPVKPSGNGAAIATMLVVVAIIVLLVVLIH